MKQIKDGSINIAKIIADLAGMNESYARALISKHYPQLLHQENCPNCGASMIEYIYQFDVLTALLLLEMAKKVKEKLAKVGSFTIANQVRIPELPTTLAIRCRTTIASKLGLVAKVKNENGRQVPGVWAITSRGWSALRGEPVPAKVSVWRKQIQERFDDLITIDQAFKIHADKARLAEIQNKDIKNDYRHIISAYSKDDWLEYGKLHEGALL
jgi:hypothetical protein